jgi:four helix bundle protein
MGNLPYARSYRDLVVYQKAKKLAKEIFERSKRFSKEENYSLTDQIRRSSRSIGAQISEAWAKRYYEKHFTSKLTDADGEQNETQHWIDTAFDCDYFTAQETKSLLSQCEEIGRLLGSMMMKAEQFCSSPSNFVREECLEYFVQKRSHP